MDPMEIMMKMTGFSMPQIENEKKKKKKTKSLFFSTRIQCFSQD